MANINRNWKHNITALFIANKYLFLCSVFFFLLIASVYLAFTPVTYKVATRIVLKTNQAPEQIIKNVKSPAVLQKVIDKLSLRVAYFKKRSSEDGEIQANLSPVKLVMADNSPISSSADLQVFVISNTQYKILQHRVFTYFEFDEPVAIYPFAKFKIVKSPAFNLGGKAVTIRLYSDAYLLKQYDKNLDAKFAEDDKSIELSLTAQSLKKGRTFLDKLVEVYNISTPVTYAPKLASNDPQQVNNAGLELAALKLKAQKFEEGRAALLHIQKKQDDVNPLKSTEKQQALEVLNEIQPYAKSSVDQFVLIPYGDEVSDSDLKKIIAQFNHIQEDKQHALQAVKIDHSKIQDYNTKLAETKQLLLARLNITKDGLNGNQAVVANKNSALPTLAAVNDSISKLNLLVKAKQVQYNTLLKSQREAVQTAGTRPQEPVIEKSSEHVVAYPKIGYVYLFALLIGLVLPLVVPYFKFRININ